PRADGRLSKETHVEAFRQAGGGMLAFAISFLASMALLAIFVALYNLVTPYKEMALIRAGNTAAAICLGGAIIGFVIPLAKAVAQSTGLADLVHWAIVAFVAQVAAWVVATALVPHFRRAIAENHVASAILLAALSIGIGVLNAASMTL